jgi:nonsense-mediated mRNA decay protein 3
MTERLGGDFCLVCGSETSLFIGRMCEECTRKRVELVEVPENVPWVRCARCGIVEIQGKWVFISEENIWNELIQRHVLFHKGAGNIGLAFESQTISDRHTLLHLQVEGVVDELLYTETHTMRARMANGVCLTCTRRAGNYFEATVQVRSSGRRLSDEEFKILRASLDVVIENLSDDPMFFITSEGAVTGGYDVVLGSKGLARSWGRHMASNFGGHISESNSTVGRKDGIDVTRLTLLYRKPGYDLGDVVKWKDNFWRPASWSKDGAVMERIDRRERTGATWRDLEHSNVVCQMKDFISVELITEDSSVGEFLNPENWQMTAVKLPWDYKGDKKLLLARVEDEWMALQHLGIDSSKSDNFQIKGD